MCTEREVKGKLESAGKIAWGGGGEGGGEGGKWGSGAWNMQEGELQLNLKDSVQKRSIAARHFFPVFKRQTSARADLALFHPARDPETFPLPPPSSVA